LAEKVPEIIGVQASGIEADDEADMGMTLVDVNESLAQLLVALRRLGAGKFGSGGLQVVVEKGGVVAVARGVAADAEASGGTGCAWRCGWRADRQETSRTGGCAGPSRAVLREGRP
jgi:hypothetical protein